MPRPISRATERAAKVPIGAARHSGAEAPGATSIAAIEGLENLANAFRQEFEDLREAGNASKRGNPGDSDRLLKCAQAERRKIMRLRRDLADFLRELAP